MQAVSFILRNSPVALIFNFKNYKDAEDLFKKANNCTDLKIETEDDFNVKGVIFLSDVAAITLSEYAKEMKKNAEIQLMQVKVDLQAQALAKNDIGLRMLGDAANAANNDFIPGEKKLKV